MYTLEPVQCVPSPVHFEEVATSSSSASPDIPLVPLDNSNKDGGSLGQFDVAYTRHPQQPEGVQLYINQENGWFCVKWLKFGEHLHRALEDIRQRKGTGSTAGYVTFACQTDINVFPSRWAYHKATRDVVMTTSLLLRNELKTRYDDRPISLWNVSSKTMGQVIQYMKCGVVLGPIREMNAFIKAKHVLRIGAVWPKTYAYCLAAVLGPEQERVVRTSQHKPWITTEDKVSEISIAPAAGICGENAESKFERFICRQPNMGLSHETVNEMLPPLAAPFRQRRSVIVESSPISYAPLSHTPPPWATSTQLLPNISELPVFPPATTEKIMTMGPAAVTPIASPWPLRPVKKRNIYTGIYTNPHVDSTFESMELYSPAYQYFKKINAAGIDSIKSLPQTNRESKVCETPPTPPNTPADDTDRQSPEAMTLPTPPQSRSCTPFPDPASFLEPIYTSAAQHSTLHQHNMATSLSAPTEGYAFWPRMPFNTPHCAIISPTATKQTLPARRPHNNTDVVSTLPSEIRDFNHQSTSITPQPSQRSTVVSVEKASQQMTSRLDHHEGGLILPPSVASSSGCINGQSTTMPPPRLPEAMPMYPHPTPRKKFMMSLSSQDVMPILPPASQSQPATTIQPPPPRAHQQSSTMSPAFIKKPTPMLPISSHEGRPIAQHMNCTRRPMSIPLPSFPRTFSTSLTRRGRPPINSTAPMGLSLPPRPHIMGPPPPKRLASTMPPPIPALKHYPCIVTKPLLSPPTLPPLPLLTPHPVPPSTPHPLPSPTLPRSVASSSSLARSASNLASSPPPRKIVCPQPVSMESLENPTTFQGSQVTVSKSVTKTKTNIQLESFQSQQWRINFMQRQFLNQLALRQQYMQEARSSAAASAPMPPRFAPMHLSQALLQQQQSAQIFASTQYNQEPPPLLQPTPPTNQSTFYRSDANYNGYHSTNTVTSRPSSPPVRPLCKWCGLTFCSKRILRHHYLFVHRRKESLQNFAIGSLATTSRAAYESVKNNNASNKSGACFHGGQLEQLGRVLPYPPPIPQPPPWWN